MYQNIRIKYDNSYKDIEKRALCQPQTFKVLSKDKEAAVGLKTIGAKERLIDILTDVAMESIFKDITGKHMKDQGYRPEFIKGYLSRELQGQIIQLPWRSTIQEKITKELESDDEVINWNFETFLLFQVHDERQWVREFAELCDKEIQDQLIDASLSPFMEQDMPPVPFGLEEGSTVEIVQENLSLRFVVDETSEWDGEHLKEAFHGIFQQAAYNPDSLLYEEYTELVLTVLLAKLYRIEKYVCEDLVLKNRIEALLKKYDLNTKVALHDYIRD